jgi:hypothetical protein
MSCQYTTTNICWLCFRGHGSSVFVTPDVEPFTVSPAVSDGPSLLVLLFYLLFYFLYDLLKNARCILYWSDRLPRRYVLPVVCLEECQITAMSPLP